MNLLILPGDGIGPEIIAADRAAREGAVVAIGSKGCAIGICALELGPHSRNDPQPAGPLLTLFCAAGLVFLNGVNAMQSDTARADVECIAVDHMNGAGKLRVHRSERRCKKKNEERTNP